MPGRFFGPDDDRAGYGVLSLRTSIGLTSFRRWRPPLRATPPPSSCPMKVFGDITMLR